MKNILAARNVFAVSLCLCTAAAFAQRPTPPSADRDMLGALPPECHAISYDQDIFPGGSGWPTTDALGKIRSFDVVCFGDKVTFRRDVRTGGGQLLVMANEINFKARVDTRPYFPLDGKYRYLDKDEVANDKNSRHHINRLDVSANLSKAPNYVAAVGDYYRRCFDCIRLDKEIWGPELPVGTTLPHVRFYIPREDEFTLPWRRKGELVEDQKLDRAAARSGDITLIARSIVVEERFHSSEQSRIDPLECDVSDVPESSAAINASGARGGRGGMGTPDPCFGASGCEDRGKDGFVNSPGGRGGDAGNVLLLRRSEKPITQFDFKDMIDVRGGPTGSKKSLFLPPVYRFKMDGRKPNICGFFEGKNHPLAGSGEDGVYTSIVATDDESFYTFFSLLRALDGRPNRNLRELADTAIKNDTFDAISFQEHVEKSLLHMVRRVQRQVALSLLISFDPDNRYSDQDANAPIATLVAETQLLSGSEGLLNTSLPTALSKRYVRLLSNIHSTTYKQLLEQYFITTGGIANVPPNQFDAYVVATAELAQLRLQTVALNEIANVLLSLERLALDENYHARLDRVNGALEDIETSLNAALNVPAIDRLAEVKDAARSLQYSAKSVREAFDKYEKAVKEREEYAGNDVDKQDALEMKTVTAISAAYGSIPSAVVAFNSFVATLGRKKGEGIPLYLIEQYRVELSELHERVAELEHSYSRSQRNQLARIDNQKIRVLMSKNSYNSVAHDRAELFDSLFKLSLIAQANSPGLNTDTYYTRLEALADGGPTGAAVEFAGLGAPAPKSCTYSWFRAVFPSAQDECISLRPKSSTRIVYGIPYDDRLDPRLPLYVLAPSNNPRALSTLGFKFSHVEVGPQ